MSFFGGKSKPSGRCLAFIPSTDGQPLPDGVEKAQDHWKRNFVGFLADLSLTRGKGGCLTAFVIDGLL